MPWVMIAIALLVAAAGRRNAAAPAASSQMSPRDKGGVLQVVVKVGVSLDPGGDAAAALSKRLFAAVPTHGEGGFPRVRTLLSTYRQASRGTTTSFVADFWCAWSHDRTGPLKSDVVAFLLKRLQKVDSRVQSVTAARLTATPTVDIVEPLRG